MTARVCVGCQVTFNVPFPSDARTHCGRSCATRTSAKTRTSARNSNWRGGKTTHPLYERYMDMLGRCYRPTHLRYADYGGRGITVCDRWREDFWAYVEDLGQPPTDMHRPSVDRIDNDGPYSPSNTRWATAQQQRANRRPQRLGSTCGNGHEYTPENTAWTPEGKRRCRACTRAYAAAGRQRRAVAA